MRVDKKGLGETLRVYGVGGKLLEGVRSFYENASASVRVHFGAPRMARMASFCSTSND